ncbi:MAG: hypothetical protein ACLPY5_04335 [Candidatus Bathyarchaeia archaeon]
MSSTRLVRRSAERVHDDPVTFWLTRLDLDTQKSNRSQFNRWMNWLHQQKGWETATPRELLVRHLEAQDDYVVLDLLQNYISTLILRKDSKKKSYSTIRSFFAHNRTPLPHDPAFRIRGDKPPVQAKLTVDNVIESIHASTLRYRSILHFKWQAFLDNARLIYVNTHNTEQIIEQIQAETKPVRIDVPGRKENENDPEGRFYTYIGDDATIALNEPRLLLSSFHSYEKARRQG